MPRRTLKLRTFFAGTLFFMLIVCFHFRLVGTRPKWKWKAFVAATLFLPVRKCDQRKRLLRRWKNGLQPQNLQWTVGLCRHQIFINNQKCTRLNLYICTHF